MKIGCHGVEMWKWKYGDPESEFSTIFGWIEIYRFLHGMLTLTIITSPISRRTDFVYWTTKCMMNIKKYMVKSISNDMHTYQPEYGWYWAKKLICSAIWIIACIITYFFIVTSLIGIFARYEVLHRFQ
jgi:hypothetical protein